MVSGSGAGLSKQVSCPLDWAAKQGLSFEASLFYHGRENLSILNFLLF